MPAISSRGWTPPTGSGDEVQVLAESFNHMLDRLSEAFRGQREFVADASHELRTPLTVIRGQLEVLAAQEDPSGEEVRRVERLVQAEITRISRLVDDLLLLAQAEQTDFLRPRRSTLHSFVEDLWDGVSLTAERRFELGPVPEGALEADPDRLAQALRNLARNAIEHTAHETGLVRLEVERVAPDKIRFAVIDDGPGSRPPSASGSSSAFTAPTRPARGPRAAPGSAWRSSARSPRPTAARSARGIRATGAGRAWSSCCRAFSRAERSPARRRLPLALVMNKRYHVTTFGCQMNEHDSERMKGMLESLGYARGRVARDQADLILFNTCSIREKADNRFIAHLGEAKRLKRERPDGSSASAAAGRSRSRTRCSRASRSSTSRSAPARCTSSPSS